MADTYQCTLCDETVSEGARLGHLRLSDGDGHGPQHEMPDDYDENVDDFFIEADGDGDPAQSSEPADPEESADDGGDTGNSQSAGTAEATGAISKLKNILLSDVSEL